MVSCKSRMLTVPSRLTSPSDVFCSVGVGVTVGLAKVTVGIGEVAVAVGKTVRVACMGVGVKVAVGDPVTIMGVLVAVGAGVSLGMLVGEGDVAWVGVGEGGVVV